MPPRSNVVDGSVMIQSIGIRPEEYHARPSSPHALSYETRVEWLLHNSAFPKQSIRQCFSHQVVGRPMYLAALRNAILDVIIRGTNAAFYMFGKCGIGKTFLAKQICEKLDIFRPYATILHGGDFKGSKLPLLDEPHSSKSFRIILMDEVNLLSPKNHKGLLELIAPGRHPQTILITTTNTVDHEIALPKDFAHNEQIHRLSIPPYTASELFKVGFYAIHSDSSLINLPITPTSTAALSRLQFEKLTNSNRDALYCLALRASITGGGDMRKFLNALERLVGDHFDKKKNDEPRIIRIIEALKQFQDTGSEGGVLPHLCLIPDMVGQFLAAASTTQKTIASGIISIVKSAIDEVQRMSVEERKTINPHNRIQPGGKRKMLSSATTTTTPARGSGGGSSSQLTPHVFSSVTMAVSIDACPRVGPLLKSLPSYSKETLHVVMLFMVKFHLLEFCKKTGEAITGHRAQTPYYKVSNLLMSDWDATHKAFLDPENAELGWIRRAWPTTAGGSGEGEPPAKKLRTA